QGVVNGSAGGRWRHQRANPVRRQRYRRALPDATADYAAAPGQHLDEGGVISAGFRSTRPRRPLAGHSRVHFHHYEGRRARQVIANGDTVRRRNRNPSAFHCSYCNAVRATVPDPEGTPVAAPIDATATPIRAAPVRERCIIRRGGRAPPTVRAGPP